MEDRRRRKRVIVAKFHVGYVRISKAKFKFAKGGEHNYTTEVFRINNVVHRTPRPVYELEDLRGQQIDGQIYAEELNPVGLTKRTTYKIDKILDTKVRRGIHEYSVLCVGYGRNFDSWIPASSVKKIAT
jgi:hypothetical protein